MVEQTYKMLELVNQALAVSSQVTDTAYDETREEVETALNKVLVSLDYQLKRITPQPTE